ncbi:MAG TPA: DUF5335 family protein [Thermomicrobiales bacterium]|nr:DUF5335 family protein [Thermomicrobiales bacterium]
MSGMETREIPRDHWVQFFDRFSNEHQGERVTVEVLGAGDDTDRIRPVARDLPLVGIGADLKDRECDITITAGPIGQDHVTHIIPAVSRVTVDRRADGRGGSLRIESREEGEATTFLRLDAAAGGDMQTAGQGRDRESGLPGGGQGRTDDIGGRSGVYPASGPGAPADAKPQGMASWGQGQRGAAGYQDHGDSEPSGRRGA